MLFYRSPKQRSPNEILPAHLRMLLRLPIEGYVPMDWDTTGWRGEGHEIIITIGQAYSVFEEPSDRAVMMNRLAELGLLDAPKTAIFHKLKFVHMGNVVLLGTTRQLWQRKA